MENLERTRVLTEAGGIKVIMTSPNEVESGVYITCRTSIVLRLDDDEKKSCGFHVTRSKWDPYPWVGYVEPASVADFSGLRSGDCLLEIDGIDVVGLRVKEIASLIKKEPGTIINLQVWRNTEQNNYQDTCDDGAALSGPLPTLVRKLAKAVSGTVRTLECPVCLETAISPISQCVHGHILCSGCRSKTPRCPVCRVRLGQGRCLVADEVQRHIREAFEDTKIGQNQTQVNLSLREKLFGKMAKKFDILDGKKNHNLRGKNKPSLARLLLGGFEKAVSAENLVTIVENNQRTQDESPGAYRRLGELCQHDRTKSASTGELCITRSESMRINENINSYIATSSGHLINNTNNNTNTNTNNIIITSFPCPLSRKTNCREPINYNELVEHLGRIHIAPQVHFYDKKATIPIPLPFGSDSMYILHYEDEIFFFQYEDEVAWVTGTGPDREWILYGWGSDGTEVKLRKQIVKIHETTTNSLDAINLAPIPNALCINSIDLEIIFDNPIEI
ncbi:hypothetical protein HCN44_002985 [Aphidius gifuensis]|uniref:Uncharacterized protein n=1 Tax=Aphidius gifuensis TaxID=684658 RepID=A0A834XQ90_APHGI|nr:hypothetical protein HCN44_002985 [Aphidius gifuensis]